MKRTRHKVKSSLRIGLVCLLCLLTVLFCGASSALAAEPAAAPEAWAEEDLPEVPAEPLPEEDTPELPEQEEALPEEAEEAAPAPLEIPQEEKAAAKKVTITFQLGIYGTKTVTVEQGQYPGEVPEIPQLPAAYVQGWYDKAGNPVFPGSVPVEKNVTYVARWSRNVSSLLNTDSHTAYVQGHNGIFRPGKGVTRAEAAQMLYSLLRDKSWEQKSFSDVSDQWFANAVGTMAGLGVIRGYTDGKFYPNRQITRAEFVTMVVACDTILEGTVDFPDISPTAWYTPYVVTAYQKGWISGYTDGKFHPDDKITRAQAVTIINKMLGRVPDKDIKEKTDARNFYDVFPDNWAYGQILEAATEHSYYTGGDSEIWTSYEKSELGFEESRWIKDGSTLYYLDGATGKFLRGEQKIDGKKYIFDSTGAAFTGFRKEGSWNRYYKNGLRMDDISGLGVVKAPYFIKVYKNSNYLIIFAKDDKGNYNIPLRAMRTSCGDPTPVGTFYTPANYRWLQMYGDTWAQWCTQIYDSYLFHSVPNWTKSNMDLEVDEYNHLGDTRSLGCIRLNCRDAKWIYDNVPLGTTVTITTSESSGPLSKPAGLAPLPAWHTWDPTDPTAQWRCKEKGCH